MRTPARKAPGQTDEHECFPRQPRYSGGHVCDNKPDAEGTECNMRMNFKMKPETPAGSAAASGCTPRLLGVMCSPSSALRETSGEGGRKTVVSKQVLSLSPKAPGTARGLAQLSARSAARAPEAPASATSRGRWWPTGLALYADPVTPQLEPWASDTGQKPICEGHSPKSHVAFPGLSPEAAVCRPQELLRSAPPPHPGPQEHRGGARGRASSEVISVVTGQRSEPPTLGPAPYTSTL